METFKVGDVVALKSGGPKMTVDKVNEKEGIISCAWSDTNGKNDYREFSTASLTKADKDSRSFWYEERLP